MTDDPQNPRPAGQVHDPEEPPESSGPASAANIPLTTTELPLPPGYPDRRSEWGKGVRKATYNFSPVAYEYDLYDWAWRVGFCVLGLVLGFLIGHFV